MELIINLITSMEIELRLGEVKKIIWFWSFDFPKLVRACGHNFFIRIFIPEISKEKLDFPVYIGPSNVFTFLINVTMCIGCFPHFVYAVFSTLMVCKAKF